MSRLTTNGFLLLVHLIHICISIQYDDAYLLRSRSLPADMNFMPTLGNGHLGYTVFGDSIFMNGVYNGRGGNSRRARIPNWLNISLSETTTSELQLLAPEYEMNLQIGCFSWTQRSRDGQMLVQHRIYAHRYYTRALVYDLHFRRLSNTNVSLSLKLLQRPGNASDSFDFQTDPTSSFYSIVGQTRLVEHVQFQPTTKRIFILFSDNWTNKQQKLLLVPPGKQYLNYRYIITIAEQLAVAEREMTQVLTHTTSDLLDSHSIEWQRFWYGFNVTLRDNLVLIINAGIFYMASSLPSTSTFQPSGSFFGLSPTGLGRGYLAVDYEGHTFWDTEIWMLPVVTQLSTEWSRQLLDYRRKHLPGAQYNAVMTGYKGARYPWESAYTGTEVTQPCCPEVAAQEIHISADIVLALETHYIVSADRQWLCKTSWPLVKEIAKFLASRVDLNKETNEYHINLVMGPDEDHWNISDSIYTNVAFKKALDFASFSMKYCTVPINSNDYEHWLNISKNLHICYDNGLNYHPEYADYIRGTEVKQADVILLGYPLQYVMNDSTRHNDLEYYEAVTRLSGPAMSWSMFAINFLDAKDGTKADTYFQKGYLDYVRQPFNVWSETTAGVEGAANFLTGVGGFLQALMNGYAGLRFHRDGLRAIMEVRPARMAPETTTITIDGVKFADATFALHISHTNFSTVKCVQLGSVALTIAKDKTREPLHEGVTYYVNNATVRIEAFSELHN